MAQLVRADVQTFTAVSMWHLCCISNQMFWFELPASGLLSGAPLRCTDTSSGVVSADSRMVQISNHERMQRLLCSNSNGTSTSTVTARTVYHRTGVS